MTYNKKQLSDEVSLIVSQHKVPDIKTEQDYITAGDVAKLLKNKLQHLDEMRKAEGEEFYRKYKEINDDFKLVMKPIEEIVNEVTSKQKAFYPILQEMKNAEQLLLESKAVEAGDSEVAIVNDVKSVHGEVATTTARKKATYEVMDITMVPMEYLTVNDAMVKEHLKSNFNNPLPGIRYYYDIQIVNR